MPAPEVVTVAPEPVLAPPPAAMPATEIVLPQGQTGTRGTKGTAVTTAEESSISLAYAGQPADDLKLAKPAQKQWTVPGQGSEPSGTAISEDAKAGGIGGNANTVVTFGFTAGTGGGGGGGGGGTTLSAGGTLGSGEATPSLATPNFATASGDRSLIEANRKREQNESKRSGNYEGFFAPLPADNGTAVAASPAPNAANGAIAMSDAGATRSFGGKGGFQPSHEFSLAGPINPPEGEWPATTPAAPAPLPGPVSGLPPNTLTITPNGMADPDFVKARKLMTVMNRAKFDDSNAAQVAGNEYYRNPAQKPTGGKVPIAGDVPVIGNLFQREVAPGAIPAAKLELPKVVEAAPAATPADMFGLDRADRDQNLGGYTLNPRKAGSNRLEQTQTRRHAIAEELDANLPTPTLDGRPLAMINQQKIEDEKMYQEKLAELKELKALANTNKDKLAVMLPQIIPDTTLTDLLAKREEAKQALVTLTNDYAASSLPVMREESLVEELNREIDARADGIMAGLESQTASQKATLDTEDAMMEEAREKDKQEAVNDEPYYEAKRELERKRKMHELLYSKLEAEKLDLDLPKSSMVQLTDPAQPNRNQTFWQHLNGQYESKARMMVENNVTDISGMNGAPSYSPYDPYFVQSTFEIIQSEAVLGKVVDALNLESAWANRNGGEKLKKSDAVAELKKRLDLRPVQNTKLIEIGVTSGEPEEAAQLANAVAQAYKEYRFEARRTLTTNGLAVLEEQFQQQEQDIKTNVDYLEKLRQELQVKEGTNGTDGTNTTNEKSDLPLRKPAPNAPVPQPEVLTKDNAFSTFSLNVSDVSFKLAEASLQNNKLPDAASIRSEEFINAFDYRDPEAAAGQPLAFAAERARYPFAHNRELLRFAIKTAAAGRQQGRALNLVLLLDNSGSMERADRVAIIHEALRVLATQLQPQDTVSVVTFSRTARLWADGISGDKAGETLDRVGGITPEGGTNLEEAMRLAYETAHRHYLAGGMNRVVLLTDGAANLGNVDPGALKQKVEAQRKQGIALDCFGIGWEDFNDDLLEELSSNGDGRYAFLNSPEDAAKDFAAKLAGALQIAAADVKVQVEFNPARVISYRQIGYAKHQLTKEQFRDNSVAAGEIAAQEAGNALYTVETNPGGEGPVATVHVRYRVPGTTDYRERSWDVAYTGTAPALDQSSVAMRLAATASAFSEWLAASPYAQEVTPDELLKYLNGVPEVYGADDRPKQLETMIREAKSLQGNGPAF